MLSENLKTCRKAKGLSQEELAIKLHVVRQTVSKWEKGLSVPDADLLLALSEALETPVSTLLGETIAAPQADDLKAIAEKLEVINLQLAKRKRTGKSVLHWVCIEMCIRDRSYRKQTPKIVALLRQSAHYFEQMMELSQKPQQEIMLRLVSTTDPGIVADALGPVSYTHLDVYKRQVLPAWRPTRPWRRILPTAAWERRHCGGSILKI